MQLGANLSDGILESNITPISLPKLNTLRLRQLRSRHGTSDTLVLRLLRCPALYELDISYWNEMEEAEEILLEPDMPWMAADVKQFLKHSRCVETGTLQRFRLHALKISCSTEWHLCCLVWKAAVPDWDQVPSTYLPTPGRCDCYHRIR